MTTASRLVLGSMQLFVAVIGMIGNLLVILIILRNPRLLRNTYYFFVLHLAICDFFINVFSSSYIYDSFNGKSMISSPVLCKLWWPIHTVFFSAGVFFMVAISIVRYQAVAKPLKPPVSRWKVKVLAVLVYVFATICVLPYVLVLQFNYKSGCVEEWPVETLNICYTLFLANVQYLIPVVLLAMMYWKICIALVKQNRKLKVLPASTSPSQQQNVSPYQRLRQHRNVRTFLVSFTVVVCFAVTTLLSQIIYILSTSNVIEFPGYTYWFLLVENFGVSAVNPFVYGTLDKKLFFSLMKRVRKILP